jgi:hypothetical protein
MATRLQWSATEHDEQVALIRWVDLRAQQCPALQLLFAIPNGGQRDVRVAAKLQAEGVRPGVPDLCLPVARHGQHGLYIELKRRASRMGRGRVRPAQQWWHDRLRLEGYRVVVCEGWDAARDAIMEYLGLTA